MAEVNQYDLKMNLIADDEASSVLKDLAAVLDVLKSSLASLEDIDPLAALQDSAEALVDAVKSLSDSVRTLSDDLEGLQGPMEAVLEMAKGFKDLAGDIKAAQDAGNTLKDTLQALNDEAKDTTNPFSKWTEGAETTDAELQDVQESVASVRDLANTDLFVNWSDALSGVQSELSAIAAELRDITDMAKSSAIAEITRAMTGVSSSSSRRRSTSAAVNLPNLSPEEAEKWFLGLQEDQIPEALREDYQAAMESYLGWGATNPEARDLQAPAAFYEQFQKYAQWQAQQAQGSTAQVQEETPARSTTPEELLVPAWAKTASEINETLSELPMKTLTWGMNAMMGYYGIQSIANSTNNLQAIQEMMQLNNQTVNEAAQSYAMLASMGMTGTSGVQFLQNLEGNLQKLFTPEVGSGALSQQAILLESLGITRQDLTTSPWMLLNTIGVRYRQLLSQGRGQQAAELLNLTGTSELAPMLQNWSTLQKQTSGINMNMTPQQLNAAVQQNLTLQASLQKLSLAFTQLAVALAPLVEKITKALTDVANAITQSKNPFQAMGNIVNAVVKDLGALPAAILGAIAALKAASFAADVMSGAGLIGEVGKGMSVGKLVGKAGRGIFNLLSRGGEEGAVALGGEAAATGAEAAVAGAEQSVSLFSRLGSILSSLAEPLSRIGALFGSLMDGLGAVMGPLADVAEAIGGALAAALGAIGAPIEAVIAAIAALGVGIYELVDHWNQIGPAMERAWQAVSQWVSQTIGAIGDWAERTWSSFADWSERTWNAISDWSGRTLTSIATWSSQTWQTISDWSGRTWNAIGQWSSETWSSISSWVSWTASEFASWVSSRVQEIAQWASTTGNQIANWVSVHTQDLLRWASSTGQSISSWVSQTVTNISNWVNSTSQSILSWANNTIQQFTGWAQHLEQWAASLWGDVSQHFLAWSKNLGAWAAGLWGDVSKDFSSWTSNLQSWASNLWGAVSSDFDSFTQNLSNWASNLWKSVSGFFGHLFGGGGSSSNVPLPNLKGNSTAQEIWNYLRSQGLTASAAAGVMGNLMQESDLNPTAVNPSSGAFGIAQWLGPRYTELVQYASKNHTSASNLAAQLGFLWSEIKSGQYVNISKLNSMNPAQAAVYFEENYEKAGSGAALANRENYAEAVYRAFASSTGTHLIYGPFLPSELPSSEKTTSKTSTTSAESKKVSEAASTAQKSLDTYAKSVQNTGTTSTTASKYVTQAASQSETTLKTWSSNQVTQFKTWATDTEKQISTWAKQVEDAWSKALNSLTSTLTKWASTVEKALENWSKETEGIFSEWVQRVQQEMAQLIAQAQSAAYAAAAAAAPSASSGKAASKVNVPKMASGGLVTSPTLALIGEAGPEVVLPLNQYPINPGAIGSLGGLGGGSGGGSMTINVNVNGPQLTDSATARKLAQVVANELVQNLKRRANFDWT